MSTLYCKIVGSNTVYSYCKSIRTANGVISKPTAEQIAAEGWQVYVPPIVPPQPQDTPGMDEIMQAVKKMLSSETEELSDEDALNVAALFPTWSSLLGESVTAGTRVWDDGKLWKVIQPHTFQANWRPADTPALFVEVSIEEIPDWRQPTGAQDIYMAGDKVKHNGHTWESEVDNNSWEPGVYGWQQLD